MTTPDKRRLVTGDQIKVVLNVEWLEILIEIFSSNLKKAVEVEGTKQLLKRNNVGWIWESTHSNTANYNNDGVLAVCIMFKNSIDR